MGNGIRQIEEERGVFADTYIVTGHHAKQVVGISPGPPLLIAGDPLGRERLARRSGTAPKRSRVVIVGVILAEVTDELVEATRVRSGPGVFEAETPLADAGGLITRSLE